MSQRPANTVAVHGKIADLERRLQEALAERDEALEQQAATAEVLRVLIPPPAISRRCSMQCSKKRCVYAGPASAVC